jgi:hypothetical protein
MCRQFTRTDRRGDPDEHIFDPREEAGEAQGGLHASGPVAGSGLRPAR